MRHHHIHWCWADWDCELIGKRPTSPATESCKRVLQSSQWKRRIPRFLRGGTAVGSTATNETCVRVRAKGPAKGVATWGCQRGSFGMRMRSTVDPPQPELSSGPREAHGRHAFSTSPTRRTRLQPHLFHTFLLQRLRQPLHLTERNCWRGRPLDSGGHHHAVCAQTGWRSEQTYFARDMTLILPSTRQKSGGCGG